jgi:hypothetical protein
MVGHALSVLIVRLELIFSVRPIWYGPEGLRLMDVPPPHRLLFVGELL